MSRHFTGNLPKEWKHLPMEEIEDAHGHTWTLFLLKALNGWMNMKLVRDGEPQPRKSNYWLSYGPSEDRFSFHSQHQDMELDPALRGGMIRAVRGIAIEWAHSHIGFDRDKLDAEQEGVDPFS